MLTPTEQRRAVLMDVDGTLLDNLSNLRNVWYRWATEYGLDPASTFAVAVAGRPTETFAIVAPESDAEICLARLHAIEDEDARGGDSRAHPGADRLLHGLPDHRWGLVTSNYLHRVRARFARLDLPVPRVVVDAESVRRGKPHPEGYLLAATLLGVDPASCLVIEDSPSGLTAAREAGMTAWAVNTPAECQEANRRYDTLDDAVDDILSWQIAGK